MIPLSLCTLPSTSDTLQQLWDVIIDKHSVRHVDRQLILLDTYLNMSGNSVKLVDLQLLTRVTAFLVSRAELETRYRNPLRQIINIIKHPFKMEKASEELYYQEYIIEFFSTFGCFLLQPSSKDLIPDILEIVKTILFSKREGSSGLVPIRACIKSVEISEFLECLVDLIAVVDKDLYYLAIFTALLISRVSKLGCWTMLTRNILEPLLVRLTADFEDKRSEVLYTTFQLLWNLLRCTNHEEDWLKITEPSVLALRGLRYTLREEALLHTYPGQYNNGLNNIACTLLQIVHLFPNAQYLLSGLTEDITFFATLSESVIPIDILPKFKDTLHHLQFKKITLACMALSPISSSTLTLFEYYKVAECLVSLLSCGTTVNSKITFTPEEMIDLFESTLPVVCALYEHIPKNFINAGLMEKLITFLKVHYFSDKVLPDNLALGVVKTISFLCFSKVKNKSLTHEALKKAQSVTVLIDLCTFIIQDCGQLTIHFQTVLYHSLCVLAALMKNDQKLQKLHSDMSLNIVSSLYQRIVKPLHSDTLIDNRLSVAVSDFAWEALVWNNENILRFISLGNVFTHIDILEKSPFSVQNVFLSVLADLCEYEQSVPYLVSWRGHQGINLLSLLCRIWRVEEERLEVPRNNKGCVSDVERPLIGKKQVDLMQRKDLVISSICDIYASVRPKIYAIVQLLYRHKEVKDICEEHYKLGHDKLPCEDLVTMQIIEAYLPLKMGEIWWEIKLKQGKVLPLDKYFAETLANRYINWSVCVQRSQNEILQSCNDQLKADEEQELYSRLRSGRLTSALSALREVELLARTSDRQQLLLSHQQLCRTIEASRADVDIDLDLKTAYPRGINTFLVYSQTDVVLRDNTDQPAQC